MQEAFTQSFPVKGRDFLNAGKASTAIKSILKALGVDAMIVRRVAIAAYEAEMNVVMYAWRGEMAVAITPAAVSIMVQDEGPGIEDINLAMQEGYSTATPEMREMGFGAGMGLANIKKNADDFRITSTVGKGTR